jgi:chromosome segregation ATPase
METNLDTSIRGSDPTVSTPGPAPFWVWLLVLGLGALALFAGYTALSNNQLYYDAETARQALARDKDRLAANVSDLKQQLEEANASRKQTETALTQSRADTAAASAQISDLQGQVGELQTKIKGLESSVATAETTAKEAAEARGALTREVATLKGQLGEAQKKLDATLADLAAARQQVQSPPAPASAPPPAAPQP